MNVIYISDRYKSIINKNQKEYLRKNYNYVIIILTMTDKNKIKFVVFDFDGVFTNGTITFAENFEIYKSYNAKDGMAFKLLKESGVEVGIISNYVYNKSQMSIYYHFNLKYTYLGRDNKIDVLTEWCKELKISLEEVAYMGDDINDCELLSKVGLSGCPKDAVKQCLEICDFISTKNGGEGCIREFSDYILEYNTGKISGENLSAIFTRKNLGKHQVDWEGSCGGGVKQNVRLVNHNLYSNKICSNTEQNVEQNLARRYINEIYNELNHQINNFDEDSFIEIVDLIKSYKNHNIFTFGVGKSGNISQHFSDLLKSISYNAFNLNTTNALHGDVGSITSSDLVILFSKSGNTKELIELFPYLKSRKCKLIGIVCDINSKFVEHCDKVILTPFKGELSGDINSIPTNSIMSQLLFINVTVSILKNDLKVEEYSHNHPAGSIGKNLKKIKEIMLTEFPKICVEDVQQMTNHNVLLEMTKYKMGCCFFVNGSNEFVGIITDGDIRRYLINNEFNEFKIEDHINENCLYESDVNKYVKNCAKKQYVPVIIDKCLIGILKK